MCSGPVTCCSSAAKECGGGASLAKARRSWLPKCPAWGSWLAKAGARSGGLASSRAKCARLPKRGGLETPWLPEAAASAHATECTRLPKSACREARGPSALLPGCFLAEASACDWQEQIHLAGIAAELAPRQGYCDRGAGLPEGEGTSLFLSLRPEAQTPRDLPPNALPAAAEVVPPKRLLDAPVAAGAKGFAPAGLLPLPPKGAATLPNRPPPLPPKEAALLLPPKLPKLPEAKLAASKAPAQGHHRLSRHVDLLANACAYDTSSHQKPWSSQRPDVQPLADHGLPVPVKAAEHLTTAGRCSTTGTALR